MTAHEVGGGDSVLAASGPGWRLQVDTQCVRKRGLDQSEQFPHSRGMKQLGIKTKWPKMMEEKRKEEGCFEHSGEGAAVGYGSRGWAILLRSSLRSSTSFRQWKEFSSGDPINSYPSPQTICWAGLKPGSSGT